MQPPPPGNYQQPPSNYPREGYGSEKFTMDMVMGIILIILSALGACGSMAMVGLGGLVGAVGAGGAANGAGSAGTAAVAGGGIIMVIGVLYLIACIAYIVGAVGMIGSKKKGLNLVMIVGGILLALTIIMSVVGGSFNILGVLIGLIFPGYSAARLFGKFGPAPLEG